MTKRLIPVIVAVGAMLGAAIPAHAADTYTGPRPTFRTETTYFHCGSDHVRNTQLGDTGWDTTAPTTALSAGGGCLMTDPNLVAAAGTAQENIYDAVFSGSFTGNLRDFTVRLYATGTQARSGGSVPVKVRLAIDGEQLFTTSAAAKTATIAPSAGPNQAIESLTFSVKNLATVKEIRDADGNLVDIQRGGLAQEDGDGVTDHTVLISVDLGGQSQGFWVIDSTDTPAGITFNPATLAAAKITSPLPTPQQ